MWTKNCGLRRNLYLSHSCLNINDYFIDYRLHKETVYYFIKSWSLEGFSWFPALSSLEGAGNQVQASQ